MGEKFPLSIYPDRTCCLQKRIYLGWKCNDLLMNYFIVSYNSSVIFWGKCVRGDRKMFTIRPSYERGSANFGWLDSAIVFLLETIMMPIIWDFVTFVSSMKIRYYQIRVLAHTVIEIWRNYLLCDFWFS